KAYLTTETSPNASNLRSAWYGRNRRMMLWVQYALAAIFLAGGLVVLPKAWPGLVEMHALEWILLFVFPLASVVYYGFTVGDKSYNIRTIGWLKPFVIGFTWAGLVN